MKHLRYILSTLAIPLFLLSSHGQHLNRQQNLTWEVRGENQHEHYLSFPKAQINPRTLLPEFAEVFPLGREGKGEYELTNVKYTALTADEAKLVNLNDVSNNVQVNTEVLFSRGERFEHVSFCPIRLNKERGQLEKIASYTLIRKTGARTKTTEAQHLYDAYLRDTGPFAKYSVLQSGEWHKIAVHQDGVYKIDYSFLRALGLDTSTAWNSLHLYGNGEGLLPIENDVELIDDLLENAIQVVDENNNGKLDPEDYFLFYGRGADQWNYDPEAGQYKHQTHYYSDSAHYFIRIHNKDPKRLQQTSDFGEPNRVSSTFDDFVHYGKNDVNLIKSGRIWFGEKFDIETSRTFSFFFKNIVPSSQVRTEIQVISKTLSSNPNAYSSFYFSANNARLDTLNLTSVGKPSYYNAPEGRLGFSSFNFNSSVEEVKIKLDYEKENAAAFGYLDYINVFARRRLEQFGNQMLFRDLESIGPGNVTEFAMSGMQDVDQIWDVTSPANAALVSRGNGLSNLSFLARTDTLREFIAFKNQSFLQARYVRPVANQNLHGLRQTDMVIVCPNAFLPAADELADFHRQEGLRVHVVTDEEVYNEFSSGSQDASAIKHFLRMFYIRAEGKESQMPSYLLLMGDGSYDNKNRLVNNTNVLPTYQSYDSWTKTFSYVTDDYFGFMDEQESDGLKNLMDIGVGRFPVNTLQEAQEMVAKIKHYGSGNTGVDASGHCGQTGTNGIYRDWRNIVCFVADDEDNSIHVKDTETLTKKVDLNHPEFNVEKIYLDAYKQLSTPGGERYPDVSVALENRVNLGALILNYMGHGGEIGWAHERILDVPTIKAFSNLDNMPVFMTATCEFSRFDDPSRTSAGEFLAMSSTGGSIALLTTTRVVFSSYNYILNNNFYSHVLRREDNENLRLGEICRLTKNASANVSSSNHRNFSLLGDPALKLAIPEYNVVTTSINEQDITLNSDTISALEEVTISGHLADRLGNKLTQVNGILYPSVFDKTKTLTTFGQDASSTEVEFDLQNSIIYKGKASVKNGEFSFSFPVPKDIAYQFGPGRISYYFVGDQVDGNGYNENLIVGGSADNVPLDNQGPEIDLYMNDESFVDGGLTNEEPYIYAKIFDENGINTVGHGLGHDLKAIVDGNSGDALTLNQYYEADLDTYKSGVVKYQLRDLEEGRHEVSLKVWDIQNNSSETSTSFVVTRAEDLKIEHLLNYPNPFTTKTDFFFEHNQACSSLDIRLQIFSASGKLVKNIVQSVATDGFRTSPIPWDGKDDFGQKLAKGVYIYKLEVTSADGTSTEVLEKLVLL